MINSNQQTHMKEFSQIVAATDSTNRIYLRGTQTEKKAALISALGKANITNVAAKPRKKRN
ncbi:MULTISPECIES: hypothetical protein [Pseudoalteromonas]|mgnify:FL=1|uniref:hypothetical protein n=1 Tax=Pseudoalteromonas TaxID=53246 RepID=UPI0003D5E320|nr:MULTISPECIES: hypothetical protein [Pseudoalteromonas]MDY6888887.1 hypothetical protein [Pseudomonadota bacterium]ETJ48875.1 hypothetical protein X564_06610 [Pseudoalteromonas agarivorans]MDC9565801.1 hypothetical protein [Pseudoalteromonas sp. GAB2316C]MDC9570134.1 hypothetical protein [Pseudoalteromonas sp. GABNB9D]MDC9574324.1 hypothetical protein [Pseudoalteromonas sp. GABNS16A]